MGFDREDKAFGGCFLFCICIFMLPLNITSLVLSQRDNDCNEKDNMGLSVSDYLIGGGISGIIFTFVLCKFVYDFFSDNDRGMFFSGMAMCLYVMFGLAWFIIGAVILFRSNIECIEEGSVMVIYALVFWCLAAFSLIGGGNAGGVGAAASQA